MKAGPPHDSILQAADVNHPIGHVVGRITLAIGAWLGSIAAGDIQIWVAIIGGVGVAVYTWLNAWVLWRDKVRRKPDAPPGGAQ
jgi:hypothetical protein